MNSIRMRKSQISILLLIAVLVLGFGAQSAYAETTQSVSDAPVMGVASAPGFPDVGGNPNFPDVGTNLDAGGTPSVKIIVWATLSGILAALVIFFVFRRRKNP